LIADVCSLPFRDRVFDITFEKDVLHHVKDPEKTLREVMRVTSEKGTVIVVEANRMNPLLYLHMTLVKEHQHFTKTYLKALLASVLKDVKITSIEAHVYPINNQSFLRFMCILESLLGKFSLLNGLFSYNICIAKIRD